MRIGEVGRRLLTLAALAAETEETERKILAAAQHRLRVATKQHKDRGHEIALLVRVIDRARQALDVS